MTIAIVSIRLLEWLGCMALVRKGQMRSSNLLKRLLRKRDGSTYTIDVPPEPVAIHTFGGGIVMADPGKYRFASICPVCGALAESDILYSSPEYFALEWACGHIMKGGRGCKTIYLDENKNEVEAKYDVHN